MAQPEPMVEAPPAPARKVEAASEPKVARPEEPPTGGPDWRRWLLSLLAGVDAVRRGEGMVQPPGSKTYDDVGIYFDTLRAEVTCPDGDKRWLLALQAGVKALGNSNRMSKRDRLRRVGTYFNKQQAELSRSKAEAAPQVAKSAALPDPTSPWRARARTTRTMRTRTMRTIRTRSARRSSRG